MPSHTPTKRMSLSTNLSMQMLEHMSVSSPPRAPRSPSTPLSSYKRQHPLVASSPIVSAALAEITGSPCVVVPKSPATTVAPAGESTAAAKIGDKISKSSKSSKQSASEKKSKSKSKISSKKPAVDAVAVPVQSAAVPALPLASKLRFFTPKASRTPSSALQRCDTISDFNMSSQRTKQQQQQQSSSKSVAAAVLTPGRKLLQKSSSILFRRQPSTLSSFAGPAAHAFNDVHTSDLTSQADFTDMDEISEMVDEPPSALLTERELFSFAGDGGGEASDDELDDDTMTDLDCMESNNPFETSLGDIVDREILRDARDGWYMDELAIGSSESSAMRSPFTPRGRRQNASFRKEYKAATQMLSMDESSKKGRAGGSKRNLLSSVKQQAAASSSVSATTTTASPSKFLEHINSDQFGGSIADAIIADFFKNRS